MRRGRWLEFAAKWQRARANRVEHLPLQLPKHTREPPTAGRVSYFVSFPPPLFSTQPPCAFFSYFSFLPPKREPPPSQQNSVPNFHRCYAYAASCILATASKNHLLFAYFSFFSGAQLLSFKNHFFKGPLMWQL